MPCTCQRAPGAKPRRSGSTPVIPGHQSDRWYGSARNFQTSARGASSSRVAGSQRHATVDRGEELRAAEHPLELVAALRVVERLDPGVRRVAGDLLDRGSAGRRRLAICGRWVIVSTCARPARRRSVSATAWAVVPPMPASISSKTIVSPPATAAIASATRESSPPEAVSATGPNGRPAFGRIRNATSSAPVGARLALARARPGTRRRRGRSPAAPPRPPPRTARPPARRAARSSACRRSTSACAAASASAAACDRVVALGERARARPRRLPALEQLGVGRAPGSAASGRRCARARPRPPRAGPARPRARRGTRAGRTRSRAAAARPGAAPRRRPASSGASRSTGATARSASATRSAAPSPSSGDERSRRRRGALGELAEVAEPLALGPQLVLPAGLEAFGVGRERAQLVEPRLRRGGVAGQLVVGAARGAELAPGARARPRVSEPGEGVEHAELVARAAPGGAARTGRSSRSAPPPPRRRPRGPRCGPRRRRACARRRRSAARARAPSSPSGRSSASAPSASSSTPSNSASTYASSPAAPISAASPARRRAAARSRS